MRSPMLPVAGTAPAPSATVPLMAVLPLVVTFTVDTTAPVSGLRFWMVVPPSA